MPNPVVHWEIRSKQPKRLQNFYSRLFDWHVDTNNPMNYGLVDTHAEGGINGGIGPAGDDATRVTFFVGVQDLQAFLNKAESLGGKTIMPPTEIPGAGITVAQFTDPDGNTIGLVKEQESR